VHQSPETDSRLAVRGARTRGARRAQEAYVKASNTEPYDNFGDDVALSGDGETLAVGAPGEQFTARGVCGDESNNGSFVAGAVYVF
jgi:hypothetical protein